MNTDLSIHRMAFREAESLGVAQALLARKRQELELRQLHERVPQDAASNGASIEAALQDMETESQALAREPDTGVLVDKTA